MVSQEVEGVCRQRVVGGGRIKRFKKKKWPDEKQNNRKFWTQTDRSQSDLAAPLQGSRKKKKNASVVGFGLFVAFFRGLRKEAKWKKVLMPSKGNATGSRIGEEKSQCAEATKSKTRSEALRE